MKKWKDPARNTLARKKWKDPARNFFAHNSWCVLPRGWGGGEGPTLEENKYVGS